MSAQSDVCSECSKPFFMRNGGRRHPVVLCGPCNKRLNWRPLAATAAVERDRRSSRDAKRRRRAAGEKI